MSKKRAHPEVTPKLAELIEFDLSEIDPVVLDLWRWGHFDNYESTWGVKPKDVPKLTKDDDVVHDALRSYQNFFAADIDEESYRIHGHSATADGDFGPATAEVMKQPRCAMPDYMAIEEARWPDSCKDNLSVSYRFNKINAALARQCWEHMVKSWSAVIDIGFDLRSEFSQNTHIWATDGPLSPSILAWSMLATGSCSQRAEERYNTNVNWSFNLLAGTIVHEVGHALGMGHLNSRNAIMYPSIVGHIIPQAGDIEYMVRLGYKKRLTPPPPKPGPDGDSSGVVMVDGKKYMAIFVPLPN